MTDLGVGLVYWQALDPLARSSGACAVLELEPQSLWEKIREGDGYRYRLNERSLEAFASFPQPKLMHGVGQPVGGTTDDPLEHVPLLRAIADRLDPAWLSEHLSFNRVSDAGEVRETGFLLPPPQTPAAARVAARNIGCYSAALARPFAFETGVNYLRRREGELDDGKFFAAVAQHAGCGILLDLHNLWCNELNGRQRVDDALAQMPLERVWEVHLAGGMPLRGYWLDGHNCAVPAALRERAAEWISRLPNLRALVFEILPEHVPVIGLDGVHRELERLEELWRLRPPRRVAAARWSDCLRRPARHDATDVEEARRAELRLYRQLTGGSPVEPDGDPGCAVLRELINEARSASLARAARYTITALVAGLGVSEARALFGRYFRDVPPDAFPAVEADRFARSLRQLPDVLDAVPYLDQILAFEAALLEAALRGRATELEWSVDPGALFAALDAGRLPTALPSVWSRMTVAAG